MRCFVGFFGLTRSLRYTADAIHTGIYQPLRDAGFSLLRAGHFNLPATISNPRSGERDIVPDRAESTLLELELCWIEAQNAAAIARHYAIARCYPDALGDGYHSLANLCHQLASLRRVWSLVHLLGAEDSDLVLLLRPDLLYLDTLDPVSQLAPLMNGRLDLIVPGWQSWDGLNDRFAFCTGRAARAYANRIDLFALACSTLGCMHPERFLDFAVRYHGLRAGETEMRAVRLRANGTIAANDQGMIQMPVLTAGWVETAG